MALYKMKSDYQLLTQKVLMVLLAWCGTAFAIGLAGVFARLHPPGPQVVLIALVAALLAACGLMPSFQAWLLAIPLSWLVAVHAVRLVGFYFLWLHHLGRLPFAFAVPGGTGDILVALLALLLLAVRPKSQTPWFAWNVLGLVDILFVVLTAGKLAMANEASMSAMLTMPLCLLPMFVVPVIIFTHVVIFERLGGHARR